MRHCNLGCRKSLLAEVYPLRYKPIFRFNPFLLAPQPLLGHPLTFSLAGITTLWCADSLFFSKDHNFVVCPLYLTGITTLWCALLLFNKDHNVVV